MPAPRKRRPSPWWTAEEVSCRSCHDLHAATLELHCEGCGARGCRSCVAAVGELWLCAGCARDAQDAEAAESGADAGRTRARRR